MLGNPPLPPILTQSSILLETKRLTLRHLDIADAEFILRLVNEPAWLQHIGDKNVHSIEDAEKYLHAGPLKMYSERGFGLYCVETKENAQRIGICGLIKRDALDDVDLGFALLAQHWRKRYAFEAASAVVAHGINTLGISRIVAIAAAENLASIGLLQRLGFAFERTVHLGASDAGLRLYAVSAATRLALSDAATD
jgi:[ribosomal protein S5]-alanine N-acetyltransferase